MIKVKNVSKSFFNYKVLNKINFEIQQGRFYTLIGENGAGKSTILRALMGLENIDSGEATILGNSVSGNNQSHKQEVGYVAETIEYNVPISVGQFVNCYRGIYPNWDHDYFKSLIKSRHFDTNKKFSSYSRGQKMQLVMILAMASRPKILLIDEITSVLDIYARKFFLNLLSKFVRDGGTVLLTTNIISEVQPYTTDLILLNKGKIKINSPLSEIPKQFKKLRKSEHSEHAIFEDENCIWAGTNNDNSNSYIVSSETFEKYDIPATLIDRRQVMLDDLFIFYHNFKYKPLGKDSNETAA